MALKSAYCRDLDSRAYYRTRDKLNSLYDHLCKTLPDCPARMYMLDSLSDVITDLEFYFKPNRINNGKSE